MIRHCSQKIATRGARAALELRYRLGLEDEDPICVYELAAQLGVGVRFLGGNSFGGMYDNQSKTIVVPALRPPGRQVFTCAHELGHWYFGHGTRIDVLDDNEDRRDDRFSPEERQVNAFAAHLLMPSRAIRAAFCRRGWEVMHATPVQIYTVASQLGVGYSTLIQHLHLALQLISPLAAEALLRTTPKKLRTALIGDDLNFRHLVLVDEAWTRVAVDLRVGDVAILPAGITLAGTTSVVVVGVNSQGVLAKALRPGITQAETSGGGWSAFLRVSRCGYVGLSPHRFLEEIDDDA